MEKTELIENLKQAGIIINESTTPELGRLLKPYGSESNAKAWSILQRLLQAASVAGKYPKYARELSPFVPDDLAEFRLLNEQQTSDRAWDRHDQTKAEHLKAVHEGSDFCRAAAPALIERAKKLLHDDAVAKHASNLDQRLEQGGVVTLAYTLLKRAIQKAEPKQPD